MIWEEIKNSIVKGLEEDGHTEAELRELYAGALVEILQLQAEIAKLQEVHRCPGGLLK